MLQYDKGWAAVNKLLRAGRSFSGNEKDCCFLNTCGPRFACVSAATGLDFADDGRGLALCDWDRDGRLDLWATYRTGPRVRFLRNAYASADNHWVELRLQGDGKTTARDAFGARVEVHREGNAAVPLVKTLYGGSGYLSQSSKWLHFGLGAADKISKIVVRWPAGEAESFSGVAVDGLFDLVQGTGGAKRWTRPEGAARTLTHAEPVVSPLSDKARVVVLRPMPLPEEIGFQPGQTRLINFWQTTCQNCARELKAWGQDLQTLGETGLEMCLQCVDPGISAEKAQQAAHKLGYPGSVEVAESKTVEMLNVLQKSCIGRQADLPTPSSFLVDAEGRVAVIYKGPVTVEQLANDVKLLGASRDAILAGAVPEPGGPWLEKPGGAAPRAFAVRLVENGFRAEAERYLRQILPIYQSPAADQGAGADTFRLNELAECHIFLGAIEFDRKNYPAAVHHYIECLGISPSHRKVRLELARTYEELGEWQPLISQLEEVLKLGRHDPETLQRLGRLKVEHGSREEGISLLRESLAIKPDKETHFHLANSLAERKDFHAAIAELRAALKLDPAWPPACNNLAWTLATAKKPELRDGVEAVKLAELAVKATDGRIPQLLGTLAAAHAEAGQFDEAASTIRKALALAESTQDSTLAKSFREKQAAYAKRRAWRE